MSFVGNSGAIFALSFDMLVRITILFLLVVTSSRLTAQEPRDMLVALHADLVKTDQTKLFGKSQIGGEFNYYASRRITATAGLEVWTGDGVSLLLGVRWYPTDHTFVRLRGLVGANDISLGAGWSKPLNDSFRIEAIGDFYFDVDFAIRAGLSYVIRKK